MCAGTSIPRSSLHSLPRSLSAASVAIASRYTAKYRRPQESTPVIGPQGHSLLSLCGASRSCRASRPLWSRPRQRLFGPSHRAARATCRRSRSVLPCGRECCPRRVFAPCPLKFDGARRAPGRGPARRSPRPPCCSPALSFLCTRAHFTPIKFTAHQAVAGLVILQGSAAGGPVCCPSAMPAGPER